MVCSLTRGWRYNAGMIGERKEASENPYRHLRLEGTRDALVVFFLSPKIVTDDDIEQVGGELLTAADTAARIDMPLSFRAVQMISSALVGKVVLLNKKMRATGTPLSLCDMSPMVAEVFRSVLPGD